MRDQQKGGDDDQGERSSPATRGERRMQPSRAERAQLPAALKIALAALATASCQSSAMAANHSPDAKADSAAMDASVPSTFPGYPIDTRPPKDFFNDRLLRTLAREASATIVCRLLGLTDVFPQYRDPDIFYDASCEVLDVISGSPEGNSIHFIWQVERGNPMPPPQSELLVYLKARKKPLDGPPALKWVALDTGVMAYTPALRDRMHRQSKKKR